MHFPTTAAYNAGYLAVNVANALGVLTRQVFSHPLMTPAPFAAPRVLAAWGETMARVAKVSQTKPDWGIYLTETSQGESPVEIHTVDSKPFGDLIHFHKALSRPNEPKLLLIAPISGHFATLLRDTVETLLPHVELYVTDWRNARDVPVSEGSWDIEDYVEYLLDWFSGLGPNLHVMAICQPAPLALVAAARHEQLAAKTEGMEPLASLTMMGGPVDHKAGPTGVTKFSDTFGVDTLKRTVIHSVGHAYKGRGRPVYPGMLQLSAFMSMNADRHRDAFADHIMDLVHDRLDRVDRHNRFYDEYLSVMDMTAEFYLSTVDRVFAKREVGSDTFTLRGEHVPIAAMRHTPIMVVEGGRDDIAGPGQCKAALSLTPHIPDSLKRYHLEPGVGHYGVFSGSKWRSSIAPKVVDFMEHHTRTEAERAEFLALARELERDKEPTPEVLEDMDALGEDDLTLVRGVGPTMARKLNKAGIYTFAQLARWPKGEREKFRATIGERQASLVNMSEWPKLARQLLH